MCWEVRIRRRHAMSLYVHATAPTQNTFRKRPNRNYWLWHKHTHQQTSTEFANSCRHIVLACVENHLSSVANIQPYREQYSWLTNVLAIILTYSIKHFIRNFMYFSINTEQLIATKSVWRGKQIHKRKERKSSITVSGRTTKFTEKKIVKNLIL